MQMFLINLSVSESLYVPLGCLVLIIALNALILNTNLATEILVKGQKLALCVNI